MVFPLHGTCQLSITICILELCALIVPTLVPNTIPIRLAVIYTTVSTTHIAYQRLFQYTRRYPSVSILRLLWWLHRQNIPEDSSDSFTPSFLYFLLTLSFFSFISLFSSRSLDPLVLHRFNIPLSFHRPSGCIHHCFIFSVLTPVHSPLSPSLRISFLARLFLAAFSLVEFVTLLFCLPLCRDQTMWLVLPRW